MPKIHPPTHQPRRPLPLRQRATQTLGWLGFVGGGLVTPHLAAKAAARLWCKLPGNQGRRKDNRPWLGHLEMVDVGLKSPLAVETWEPYSNGDEPTASAPPKNLDSAPTVWLVHGWGGWRGQVAAFVKPLTAAGFRVVAADSLSHGDSGPGTFGPRHSSGGELMRSFEALAAHSGSPYGVIAHSLGCAAVCRSLLRQRLTVERMALVSPSPDMERVAHAFARSLGFRPRTERLLITEMEKRAQGPLADFNVANMGATGLLPPALVIHDRADKESPYRTAQDIADRWKEATLVTTEGLGHHRILIKPTVVEQAAAHIIS